MSLHTPRFFFCVRAENGTRTHDLLITNELLYQLSYFGKPAFLKSGANISCFFETRNKKRRNNSPFFVLCQRKDFETHSENSFLIVVTDDFEGSYFGSVFHMKPDTETFVVIAYMHYPNCI